MISLFPICCVKIQSAWEFLRDSSSFFKSSASFLAKLEEPSLDQLTNSWWHRLCSVKTPNMLEPWTGEAQLAWTMELAGELLTHRESILKVLRVLRHQLVSRMGLWSEPSSSKWRTLWEGNCNSHEELARNLSSLSWTFLMPFLRLSKARTAQVQKGQGINEVTRNNYFRMIVKWASTMLMLMQQGIKISTQ